ALHDARVPSERVLQPRNEVRELLCDVLEMAGEQADPLGADVGLHPEAVVLVLKSAPPESLEDLIEGLEPFAQHRADRAVQFEADLRESLETLLREEAGDLPEVAGDVVRALDRASVRFRRARRRDGVH